MVIEMIHDKGKWKGTSERDKLTRSGGIAQANSDNESAFMVVVG